MASIENSAKFTANQMTDIIDIYRLNTVTDDRGVRNKIPYRLNMSRCNVSIVTSKDNSGDVTHRTVSYRITLPWSRAYNGELMFIYKHKKLLESAPTIVLNNGLAICDCYELVNHE